MAPAGSERAPQTWSVRSWAEVDVSMVYTAYLSVSVCDWGGIAIRAPSTMLVPVPNRTARQPTSRPAYPPRAAWRLLKGAPVSKCRNCQKLMLYPSWVYVHVRLPTVQPRSKGMLVILISWRGRQSTHGSNRKKKKASLDRTVVHATVTTTHFLRSYLAAAPSAGGRLPSCRRNRPFFIV